MVAGGLRDDTNKRKEFTADSQESVVGAWCFVADTRLSALGWLELCFPITLVKYSDDNDQCDF